MGIVAHAWRMIYWNLRRASRSERPAPEDMRRMRKQHIWQLVRSLIVAACFCAFRTTAQPPASNVPARPSASQQTQTGDPDADDSDTVFPHSETSRYWISGQANIVVQGHGAFPAKYSGPHSLPNWAQTTTTHLLTLFTGYELTRTTEVFLDVEDATGTGVGNTVGLAGYVNLDAVRIRLDMPGSKDDPYLAQFMLRQIIPLTKERVAADRDELDLATSLPARRIEFRLGKMDLTDFIDANTYGTDSNLQFLNWTVDDNGAYDVASNTRGYTDAAMLEYDDHWFSARFAEAMMPKVADSNYLDADLARARSENLELEAQGKAIAHRAGAVRLLGYLNQADMGNYREAIAEFLNHETPTPDITATRQQGRHRYGFGLNMEQSISDNFGLFARLGWTDGHNETFCYTEDDRTVQVGGVAYGNLWRRKSDRAGAAFVTNGIVAAHQQYLALGGLGIMLGDGGLNYQHEKIVEGFYTVHLWRGFFASYDFQHVNNPGYNQARGPVSVSAFRFHTDF